MVGASEDEGEAGCCDREPCIPPWDRARNSVSNVGVISFRNRHGSNQTPAQIPWVELCATDAFLSASVGSAANNLRMDFLHTLRLERLQVGKYT